MKKLLAVVRRMDGCFRGYVPKLPGCEIRAATAEQAEAELPTAAHAHIAAGKEGANGLTLQEVEVVVVVEPPIPEQWLGDGEKAAVMRWGYQLPDDDMLEAMLHPEEHEWLSFEDVMHELGYDEAEPSAEGRSE